MAAPVSNSSREELRDIGSTALMEGAPRQLNIDGQRFFLTRRQDAPVLLSAICPHAGGFVADDGAVLRCPVHNWTFDRMTGACLNSPNRGLHEVPVEQRGDRLFASVTPRAVGIGRRSGQPNVRNTPITIRLHAHACLEFTTPTFSLLTDPWLVGPAFMGAWTHYPPAAIDWAHLRPNAVLISHEHSDHFHPPTLAHFPRDLPIYVPDFPNRRMVNRLLAMGFTAVRSLPFGVSHDLEPGFTIVCLEPGSLWNDSVWLLDIHGTRVLDLGDAGLNPRIASLVAPVDIVAAGFSPGASSYPLTWGNLGADQKRQIMVTAKQGLIENLKQSAEMYGADLVLPFASHFQLGYPPHLHFNYLIPKNTVADVVAAFEGSNVGVIDLLPGDAWNSVERNFLRYPRDGATLYQVATVVDYLKRDFDPAVFAAHHPVEMRITIDEVVAYFDRFNHLTEIAYCEDLTFAITSTDGYAGPDITSVHFAITGGRLSHVEPGATAPNVAISLPSAVLAAIIQQEESWDEALIGYWCQNYRSPDIYHSGFWRLLQAPHLDRSKLFNDSDLDGDRWMGANVAVADILERGGAEADRLLRRYGLYCMGCQHSTSDTLAIAARSHGVNESQLSHLVAELARLKI